MLRLKPSTFQYIQMYHCLIPLYAKLSTILENTTEITLQNQLLVNTTTNLITAHTIYRKAHKYNKINYIEKIIENNSKDYKKLYNTTNKLLGRIQHT